MSVGVEVGITIVGVDVDATMVAVGIAVVGIGVSVAGIKVRVGVVVSVGVGMMTVGVCVDIFDSTGAVATSLLAPMIVGIRCGEIDRVNVDGADIAVGVFTNKLFMLAHENSGAAINKIKKS